MPNNIMASSPEGQGENFQSGQVKNLKRTMALELLLSRRERKAVAADLPVCQATLSDWMNEGKSAGMPVWWLSAWTREVGPGLLRWIAKENGLALVDQDEAGPVEITDSAQLLALISQHHGHVMALIIQAREDGVIDDQERDAIWPDICKLIRELEDYFRPRSKGERRTG